MGRLWSVAVLLVLVGCRARFGPEATGAATSEAAVQAFLSAARAKDLQAMSAVWGNAEGPTRDRADRQEMERRLMILVCHLRHDEARVGAGQRGEAGRMMHRVDLAQGDKQASPIFTTVANSKSGRWFVEDLELRAVSEFCRTEVRPPAVRSGAPAFQPR